METGRRTAPTAIHNEFIPYLPNKKAAHCAAFLLASITGEPGYFFAGPLVSTVAAGLPLAGPPVNSV